MELKLIFPYSWCLLNDTKGDLVQYLPVLLKSQSRLNFSFAFTPCHRVLPYEHAEISVYMSDDNKTCLDTGLRIIETKVRVQPAKLRTTNLREEAVIEYQVSSKSSFFVQKFDFDFPRKLSIFWGEKLVKMLWF